MDWEGIGGVGIRGGGRRIGIGMMMRGRRGCRVWVEEEGGRGDVEEGEEEEEVVGEGAEVEEAEGEAEADNTLERVHYPRQHPLVTLKDGISTKYGFLRNLFQSFITSPLCSLHVPYNLV